VAAATGSVKKVVLAYSGGLDTSVILRWLQDTYGCEVVTFTADLGQGEELEPARRKAEMLGIREIFIEDLREEFVRDYVFPMFRANALYEGTYLLGTSIARPLIAKRQIEIAALTGADAVAHGATGKGNDQVRFELSYYALNPDIKIIAPWREWDLTSRTKLIEYAESRQIPVPKDKRGEAPFSVDANLLHISAEGKVLEDPWVEPEEYVYSRTVAPENAPDKPTYIEIEFERGDPVAIDGERLSPAALLTRLNQLGGANGIGRLDMVENRFVGMKSRGVYETPGGTVLHVAHRAMESLTLDRGAAHLKDELMPRYAELIYNGFWFSPEREMLQALIDKSQERVAGTVRMKLYKGSATVVGRKSPKSLYSLAHVTFEDDVVYDQRDAAGFIKLNALRLRLARAADLRAAAAGGGRRPDYDDDGYHPRRAPEHKEPPADAPEPKREEPPAETPVREEPAAEPQADSGPRFDVGAAAAATESGEGKAAQIVDAVNQLVANLGATPGPKPGGPLDRPEQPAVGADVERGAALNKATMVVDRILQFGKANQFTEAKNAYRELMRMATSQDALPEYKLELSRGAFNLFVLLSQANRHADADAVFEDLSRLAVSPGALPEMRLRFAKAAVNRIADYGEADELEKVADLYKTLEGMAERIGGTPESKPDIMILDAWWRALEVYSPLLSEKDDAALDALIQQIERNPALAAASRYLAELAEKEKEAGSGDGEDSPAS
jgi:argininosuccinate synthase